MVNSLSRGMKQRLSLARALVHDPDLLILDEPASGLDPRARVELRDLLRNLHAMGKTIIISSHILAELEEVCTDVAIMEGGALLASGPPREILDRLGGTRTIRVRFADGTSSTHTVADSVEQAALLRRLVLQDGRDIVEFTEESGGLEQLFLAITQGVLQ
jgi:ABC-2 type transport system ATP-binding protein